MNMDWPVRSKKAAPALPKSDNTSAALAALQAAVKQT